MNEELAKMVEEEENPSVPGADAKIMDAADYAILKEINAQKEQLYYQLGMLVEAQSQIVEQLKLVDARKQANAEEIQKKYGLPNGQLWRVTENRQIVSVAMPSGR